MNEFDKIEATTRKIIEKCPWGKEQTMKEHINELRDEIEELKKAIDSDDIVNLKEELGDVFYDALFLMLLAEKEKNIDIREAIKQVREKVERRKPYLYGDMEVKDKDEALRIWNEVKFQEKNKKL